MQTFLKYKKNTTCVFVHNIYLWKVNCTQLGTMDGWHCHKMAISACQILCSFFRNNNGKIKIWVMSLKSLICVSFMLLSDVLAGRTVLLQLGLFCSSVHPSKFNMQTLTHTHLHPNQFFSNICSGLKYIYIYNYILVYTLLSQLFARAPFISMYKYFIFSLHICTK